MTKAVIMAGVAVAFAVPVQAQDDVVNSKHNMSTFTGAALTDYNEVCVYCHTPHGGPTATNAPLWNRGFGAGPYDMYNAAWSSTIDMAVETSPQGVSLACLSCHDGTIGLDVIINRPNADTSLAGSGNTMPARHRRMLPRITRTSRTTWRPRGPALWWAPARPSVSR